MKSHEVRKLLKISPGTLQHESGWSIISTITTILRLRHRLSGNLNLLKYITLDRKYFQSPLMRS